MANVATRRALGTVARVLYIVGMLIVAILVIHILLTIFGANPANAFASFIATWANNLSLGLTDLFTFPDHKLATGVNYGIAAVIWLVITNVVVGLVRRVG